MDYKDDPIITNANGFALPRIAWALVEDGTVCAVAHTYDDHAAPFDDAPAAVAGKVPLTGRCALKVTGAGAMIGHLVDRNGNVSASGGREAALGPEMAAYHDAWPAPVAATTPDAEPVQLPPELPPPDKPEE